MTIFLHPSCDCTCVDNNLGTILIRKALPEKPFIATAGYVQPKSMQETYDIIHQSITTDRGELVSELYVNIRFNERYRRRSPGFCL